MRGLIRHVEVLRMPGESHGQRSLVGYSPWGCKESDGTEETMHGAFTCGEVGSRILARKKRKSDQGVADAFPHHKETSHGVDLPPQKKLP